MRCHTLVLPRWLAEHQTDDLSDLQPLPEVTRENGKRKGETEEGKRKETGVREGVAPILPQRTPAVKLVFFLQILCQHFWVLTLTQELPFAPSASGPSLPCAPLCLFFQMFSNAFGPPLVTMSPLPVSPGGKCPPPALPTFPMFSNACGSSTVLVLRH